VQAGIAPVVASCGTALTSAQAQLLRRFTAKVILSFDPDAAGQGAAAKSCELLVAEGFGALEEVAYVEAEELSSIEGFDEELAAELQNRAAEALERREAAAREERRGLGVDDALAEMPYLTEQMLVTLGKANIRTLDDLADLATDELIARRRVEPRRRAENARPEDKGGVLAEYGLSEEQGNEIIMAARAHWFEDEGEDALAETPQ